jgi:peptidoglycan/xylan/chitin deacetylase (PgdA/CDA1 family)
MFTRMLGGRFVVSLDFELHWGVRDRQTLEAYRANLLGEWQAVPALLALFRRYDIHATWATVGFLFARDREELLASLPAERPHYRHQALDPYAALEGVGRDERDDPYHFAASLVAQIAATPHQEVGSHTFSHYYCLEPGQDARHFASDLGAARAIASRRGVTLRSLAFPGNQVNEKYLEVCRDAGLVAYRGAQRSWLYDPRRDDRGPWLYRAARLLDAYLPISGDNSYPPPRASRTLVDLPASRFLRPVSRHLALLEPLRARRILRDLEHAARHGRVYHLWWHPHNFGVALAENLAFLERILTRFDEFRRAEGMRSVGMAELAAELSVA